MILHPFSGPTHDTLDLHGFTAAEADAAVIAFVQRNRKRNRNALLHVITGRGRGSPGRPVLKTRVRTLLKSGTLGSIEWSEDLDGGGFLIRLT